MDRIFGAPEIIVLIFQDCDSFRDVFALAAACQYLHSVWCTNSTSIIWPLARTEILGFDQALVAARATALVCDASLANRLPPVPFPLSELEGNARRPDLQDLRRVLDLRHLVLCVEEMYLNWDYKKDMLLIDSQNFNPEADIAAQRTQFHRAMYRMLLCGAALSSAYIEPFFLAGSKGPSGFLNRIHNIGCDDNLMPEDVRYLEQFPIYNLEAGLETWEPVFGRLAEWLLKDTEKTFVPVQLSSRFIPRLDCGHLTPKDLGKLQEVNTVHVAYEHVINKYFRQYIACLTGQGSESDPTAPAFAGRTREITVVLFGVFRPEKVPMPEKVADAKQFYLVTEPLPPRLANNAKVPDTNDTASPAAPWHTDVRWILGNMRRYSGQGNQRNEWPLPPPALRFFEFLSRKHFNLRMKRHFFGSGSWYLTSLEHFLNVQDLFGPRSIMEAWLYELHNPPALNYDSIDDLR